MTESNTNGSTRNVIDAFVSAQEKQNMAPQSGVVQNTVTQSVAPQVEPKQNVVAPSGVVQPAVSNEKPTQKRKNIWKILVPVLAVAVVGVVIAVVVVLLPNNSDVTDEEDDIPNFWVAETVESIVEKYEKDEKYSEDDAISDFEKILSGDLSDKDRTKISFHYANFVNDYCDDPVGAKEILERIKGHVDENDVSFYNKMLEGFEKIIAERKEEDGAHE